MLSLVIFITISKYINNVLQYFSFDFLIAFFPHSAGYIFQPIVVSYYESSMIHGSFIKNNFLKKQVYFNMHYYQYKKKTLKYNINLM